MTQRVPVQKTYKLYIGGEFPRSESGRTFDVRDPRGRLIAQAARASRKDFRNAVVAARSAQPAWAGKTAFLRGQILYRLAEMVEARREQFAAELRQQGALRGAAAQEVNTSIDRLIHYAGWADKYQALFSTVNPVASSHFSFSVPEPVGVVALVAPDDSPLLGLVAHLAPALVGGNAIVVLASAQKPLSAITLAEAVATSDVPAGVVNILTGLRDELLEPIAGHMDVQAIVVAGAKADERKRVQAQASLNLKRVVFPASPEPSPYAIYATQETKTTWHPIGF